MYAFVQHIVKDPAHHLPTGGFRFRGGLSQLLADPEIDSIISMHVSSGCPAAPIAPQPGRGACERGTQKKISVIDSYTAYMGEGLMVIDGSRAAERG